ncbi:MAG: sulfur carrier protein ThiS [Myxococcota bacterium]
MRIEVNGESTELQAETVDVAVRQIGLEDAKVAVALNGEFVARSVWSRTSLREGDRLEVVAPMAGG